MSVEEQSEVQYTCDTCGKCATVPGTEDEHDAPRGWIKLWLFTHTSWPSVAAEVDHCDDCFADGVRVDRRVL